MSIKTIEQDLNDFYSAMQRGEKILSTFSDELDSRLGSVRNELKTLGEMTKKLKCDENTPAAGLVNNEIDVWNKSLQTCAESAEKDICGRKFMHRFEKTPLILVFGVVKAGKSTLGNFIHGREFRNAAFDNLYKTIIPKSKILIEEKGREDQEKEQFDEKITESTCSIQYFQIPGLTWVDTPGIEADKNLAELAKKYVRYADVVVFLTNSAHPELRAAIESLQLIYEKGKKVIVAISRSDDYREEPNLETGDIIKKYLPKESRKLQEDSFRNTMESKGVDTQYLEVTSISTLLAKLAIEQQDDSNWEASNMGKFYRKLADVIGNEEIIELKKREPRAQMKLSIEAILGTKDKKGSLNALIADMESVQDKINDKYDALKPDGKLVPWIVDDVISELSSVIRSHVENTSKKKKTSKSSETRSKNANIEVDLSDMQKIIQDTVTNALKNHIAQQIGDFEKTQYDILKTDDLKTTVSHKTKTNTYTRRGMVPRKQDTTLGEDFLSLVSLGWYKPDARYEMEEYSTQIHKTVDLGLDTAPAKRELEEALQKRVEEYVQNELSVLREQFFGQALSKMNELILKLETLKTNLMKYLY